MEKSQEYCFQNFGEWTYAIPLYPMSNYTKEPLALNSTAVRILTMVAENVALTTIAKKLSDVYQVNYQEALEQVQECVNTWKKLKDDSGSGRISD